MLYHFSVRRPPLQTENDGGESVVINTYKKQLGHFKINKENSISIGLSDANLTGFLTDYFFTHSDTGEKYLYGIVNMSKNVKEIRVSYDLPKTNNLPSERITRKSSVENNLFLFNMGDNTEMGVNCCFLFMMEMAI
ncbi:hypothetical protein ACSVDA_03755 [Cytobacillus sp. Hm23]